jgi:hypothetical protein
MCHLVVSRRTRSRSGMATDVREGLWRHWRLKFDAAVDGVHGERADMLIFGIVSQVLTLAVESLARSVEPRSCRAGMGQRDQH